MNKSVFNEIIRRPSNPERSSESRAQLEKAIKKYPYASLLYIAAARMTDREAGLAFEEAVEAAASRISDPRILFREESAARDDGGMSASSPNSEEDTVAYPSDLPDSELAEEVGTVSEEDRGKGSAEELFHEEEQNEEEQKIVQAEEEEALPKEKIPVEEPSEPQEEIEEPEPASEEIETSEVLYRENGSNSESAEDTEKEVLINPSSSEQVLETQIVEQTEVFIEILANKEEAEAALIQPFTQESDFFDGFEEKEVFGKSDLLNEVRGLAEEFKKYEKKCLKKRLRELKNSLEKPDKKKTEELKQLQKLRKKRVAKNRGIIGEILVRMELEADRFGIDDFRKLFTALLENYAEQDKKYKKNKRKVKEEEKLKNTTAAIPSVPKVVRRPPSVPKNLLKRAAMPRPSTIGEDRPDLSLKSVRINEELISENLAKILLKQGKTEQAIVMYGKLRLKYPEKSTYFADIIKKLEQG